MRAERMEWENWAEERKHFKNFLISIKNDSFACRGCRTRIVHQICINHRQKDGWRRVGLSCNVYVVWEEISMERGFGFFISVFLVDSLFTRTLISPSHLFRFHINKQGKVSLFSGARLIGGEKFSSFSFLLQFLLLDLCGNRDFRDIFQSLSGRNSSNFLSIFISFEYAERGTNCFSSFACIESKIRIEPIKIFFQ